MNGEYLLYLQEIKNTEWVIEIISEQFDDAMNMMTPNSIIYGGAVRDCLAGKELMGDLDIAVSISECNTMINKFIKNPKWVNISNEHNGAQYKKFGSIPTLFSNPPRRSVQDIKTPQIMTFKTLGNKTVQIIILPSTDNDPFQTVTTMVKQVDIVCCGVILTHDNKVFEVVPNAYEDCKKHILHLNNTCYVKDIENFKHRIEKLSERGWVNEININKVIRAVNRKRKQNLENEKIAAGISKHTIKNSDSVDLYSKDTIMESGYIILRDPYTPQEGATGSEVKLSYAKGTEMLSHTGYKSILSSSDIGHMGGLSDSLYILKNFAKKYGLDITIQPVKNYLIIITKNQYISNKVHDMVKTKRFIVNHQFSNKKSENTFPTHTTAPAKKRHKPNGIMTYSQLDKQRTTDDSEIDGVLKNPALTFRSRNKQMLEGSHKKEWINKPETTKIEKHFDYSTKTSLEYGTAIAGRHYQGISKNEIIQIGSISIVLSRLERIAKKHKIDIGVVVEEATITIITVNEYTSKYVYWELAKNKYNLVKKNDTEFFGGNVT